MSKIDKLLQNGTEIQWWKSTAAPYLIHKAKNIPKTPYGKLYWSLRDVGFVSVYEEDWDNLIILDACRYDIFKEEYSGVGELQLKYSKAPQSAPFFKKNFNNKLCHDLVSVTTNPHHKNQLKNNQFHSVYHLWKTHWDEDLKTVHPESVRDVTHQANESHPQKRLMVHFMQPHAPFIGPWAQKNIGIGVGIEHARQGALQGSHNLHTTNPYSLAAEGKVKNSELERGYRENLNVTLEYVRDLILKLDGKTVVTADHGELLGERAWPYPWKGYQHPNISAEKLLQVPWLVIESEKRRDIKSDKSDDINNEVNVGIEKRLADLGYK